MVNMSAEKIAVYSAIMFETIINFSKEVLMPLELLEYLKVFYWSIENYSL